MVTPPQKQPTQKHTLELLVEQLPFEFGEEYKKKIGPENLPNRTFAEKEKRVHAALLLAFYGAVQSVIRKEVLATPLFSVSYDSETNDLRFENCDGIAKVPLDQNSYTISSLDLIFACHARDMPLILEGDTGTGKTITTEAYLKTILPPESMIIMSLSHQSFTDSPKAPFEKSEMVNGMPVTGINQQNLRRIAAMYIDELNLGNPNDLLQLSYGRVLTSKERGLAGIPIPQLSLKEGMKVDEAELKRLWLSGSQNPPKNRDVQFSGQELTASMKNRFLIVSYPKILKSVGSTMWNMEKSNGLHQNCLEDFCRRYKALAGQEISLEGLRRDWLGVYAYTLNSARTEKATIRSSQEFADLLMGVLSGELSEGYQIDLAIANSWKEKLPQKMTGNFELKEKISDSQMVKNVKEVVGSFGKPFTERDDAYLKSLSDLLATIRYVKRAYQDKSKKPLQAYLATPIYITLEDVAAAGTLLARNKQVSGGKDPLTVVKTVIAEYIGMINDLGKKMAVKDFEKFDLKNLNHGLKNLIYTAALNDSLKQKDHCAEEIALRMNHYLSDLKSLTNGSDIRKIMVARTVADIATAIGFVQEHEAEIEQYFKTKRTPSTTAGEVRRFIYRLYEGELGNPTLPEIYTHRLPRIL